MLVRVFALSLLLVLPQPTPPSTDVEPLHRPYDQMLDLQVRDGLVYYRALKAQRGSLDRYVAALGAVPKATYDKWPREQQMAFWLNAYNAFVLRTVIDHYPIAGSAAGFPSKSIRQIPGAFDQAKHQAAGHSLTLDEIEKTILPGFKEPRLYLALGRGAMGSGRLRSEAYTAAKIAKQLDNIQSEFVTVQSMMRVDRNTNQITITPIIGWRDAEFIAAYDKDQGGKFAQRSPIERAIVAFIAPHLYPLERDFVQKNEFKVAYHPFDWRLNDLTGGRIE